MRSILKFFICGIFLCRAFAQELPYKNLIFTFSGGPGWSSPFQANIVSNSDNPYQQVQLYYPNIQTMGMGEVFISSEYPFYNNIDGQFGGAISGAGAANSSVNQTLNSTNSLYKYQLIQYRVAFRGKLFTHSFYFNPYVTSSFGAGFTALSPDYDPNSSSKVKSIENTAYSFNYTFGAGLQHAINQKWSFSFGYEYYNWGKADTNLLPTSYPKTYNTQLPSMNILLLSLSYRTNP